MQTFGRDNQTTSLGSATIDSFNDINQLHKSSYLTPSLFRRLSDKLTSCLLSIAQLLCESRKFSIAS